jgi:hypothetical protein
MDIERTAAGNPWGLEPLLDVKELAGYLHVPVSTVARYLLPWQRS